MWLLILLIFLPLHMSPWGANATVGAMAQVGLTRFPFVPPSSCRMSPWRPSLQSSLTAMRSMPRLSCGSRETPRHPMKPGRSVFLSEVCLFLQDWGNQSFQPLSWQPEIPPLLSLSFPYFPRTLLPSRGRWQWEVPKQIGAPPSLSDWEVRVEVEAVPESSGKEDLPLGSQTGPQQLAPASEWPRPAARPQIWAPSHIYSASLLCFLVKESAANIIFIITLSHNLPFK